MTDPNAYYGHELGVGAYDLFAGAALPPGEIEFYRRCAEHYGSPVLELGAGTGRILLALAAAGHEVVGLDRSAAMLARAAAKLDERSGLGSRVRLVEGDMARFDLGESFPLAIVAFRTFQHLVAPAQQRAALACIHSHLQPGGHLVIDLFDPLFELLFAPEPPASPPREARDPRSGQLVRRTVVERHCDPFAQTVEETLQFDVFDAAGELVRSERTGWILRWSMRQEMAYLFELSGFEVIEQLSDFAGAPPAYGREQIWIVRKR